jgi:HSP20 family protein
VKFGTNGGSGLPSMLGFDPFANFRSTWAFDYDVTRTESGYEIEVPVPGYSPSQIEVTYKDGILAVNGKNERRTFSRSFTIPEDVEADATEARVENGMLVLSLRRRPEAQAKKIQVSGT